jgi:hypothetical protein
MPAAVSVASLAVDTSSYMVSGKTMTDHGLSLAMDEDCSMMRVLDEDEEVCREEQDYEVAVAALTPLPDNPDGGELELDLASGDDPWAGDPWAGVGYAQLAHRAHEARTGQRHYLAAGMIEPAL